MRMLFTIFIFVSSFLNGFSQASKKFIGSWEGKMDVGVQLRLVIHIITKGPDSVSSTLDSPDQNVFGIAAYKTTVEGVTLYFEIKSSGASFTGNLENDSTIGGTFTQGGNVPLKLIKTDNPSGPLKRPQTPLPPYPYKSEAIEYDNADKTVHFGATFTYPNTGGQFVTTILITGSGQQDRDETILLHKPFAVIADYLTKKGFAVLRVDDRGKGKTTGEVMKATSMDFSDDVITSMDYLKTRKETDKNKIGLIGHSEGGLIASIVLTKRKDIAFIISLAGAGMKGADILSDQGELIMVKEGIDSMTAKSYKKLYKKIINYSLTIADSLESFNKTWQEYAQWKKSMKPASLQQLGFTNDTAAKKIFRSLLAELYLPWMQFFNNSDASLNYEKAYCPVLALNGSEDIQVPPAKDLEGIRSALKKSKSGNYEIKELPGLNHLFQHCKKCGLSEYGELEETFAPEALQVMGDWLKDNIK
ncbi:MAG TPA: alpha/beta hydrolase [Chitinophagaceae bacterium]|nr:alpha/beta hydrolase [Chitinophagaceae bacterium]